MAKRISSTRFLTVLKPPPNEQNEIIMICEKDANNNYKIWNSRKKILEEIVFDEKMFQNMKIGEYYKRQIPVVSFLIHIIM